ncbi:cyclase family protein [Blastopirellula sp. JC732]|uniref:Cyclase family protein n=1 Tax=Blastopirellula sediminis TaxID=2894196 RepID=A0A9X1MK77_9BACT|nr:cyclase family protein [Blastopirellula sediminis]MCC9607765.1 cyclase family protein [Blastopirellula sediminis]MCC9627442.1 cyclase family protein [Blastopirellula sediminis]
MNLRLGLGVTSYLVVALALGCDSSHKAIGVPAKTQEPSLWEIHELLAKKEFVDLTHSFEPGIPHWPGFPDEELETIYSYKPAPGLMGSGFFAQRYQIVGQWGTHCDPPAHFVEGLRTIDEIKPEEMILPLVVFDVHAAVEQNPDYVIRMEDVKAWEEKYGEVPKGAFCVMRTDWSKRWPDAKAMRNEDAAGTPHYPGWSQEVLTYLYETRKITASGHETTDTDPGLSTAKDDYTLETYVLGTNHYQIELLTNVDQLPEQGALAVVTFPKPLKGSGFPARVFAILP